MIRRFLAQGLRSPAPQFAAGDVGRTVAAQTFPNRGAEVLRTKLRRLEVIHDPALNRGSGFSAAERERLCLRGLVPPRRQGLEQQIARVMETFQRQKSPLDKFQFMSMLMDRNTVLFYRILLDNFKLLAPIVYTPTVGQACMKFHAIYRRTRGMYFSSEDRGHFASMVYNWPEDDVQVIVATDGSRILGLGDLGANGMHIPIGKLALYVTGGGINPRKTLPVVIDVGTDNAELRNNELYLGLPRSRLQGDEYWELIDEWMTAVRLRWPNALVQFEDFSSDKALPMLQKYRHKHLCFNDDIQSTGCIALAAMLASLRVRGLHPSDLVNERIVCVGAGSAGLGVCSAIVQAMVDEGLSAERAHARFYIVDKDGLLGSGRDIVAMPEAQRAFVRSDLPGGTSLEELVRIVKPTVLFGLSGVGGLFSERAVREMSRHVDRPVIFPLSNPSEMSECTAEQAFAWTDGRAIFASGSPFDDVRLPDGGVGTTNQCNNVFSFPGLGLAITALRISRVTDSMMQAAARRISELATPAEISTGLLFPRIDSLRDVSVEVAAAVGNIAMNEGIADRPIPAEYLSNHRKTISYLKECMWDPEYGHFVAE